MKLLNRLKHGFLAAALTGSLLFGLAAPAQAAGTNLLSNAGFETGTTTPANWYPDSWGTNNASFTYNTTGHTGTRSVTTTMTSYTDGDGKWLFNAVLVTSGHNYTYTDWYQSGVSTNVWAQYRQANGTAQYSLLKIVPATVGWSQTTVGLTVPSGITSLSIFHVLSSTGQLQMDDVSLSEDVSTCSPSKVNGLSNGGFEDNCLVQGLPVGWTTSQYGGAGASFAYTTQAHDGTHGVRVTNPVDGAEAGFNTTVAVAANQRYQLAFWQAGDTYIYAYAAYTLSNGSVQYASFMSVPASQGEWSQYSDNFVTPAGAVSMQITLATSGEGAVSLDTVSLTTLANQNPVNFNQGMVSLTFDDGAASTYTNGFPVLKQYGYKGTFYLNADSLDSSGFMTTSQVLALSQNGQEIGSHSYHHADIVQMDTPTLQSELAGNKTSLQEILGTSFAINSFASPYGSFTSGKLDTVMQYQQSHRNTDGRFNAKADFSTRMIHGKLVTASTSAATVQSWINQAKANHEWLVLVYHNIASTNAGQDEDVAAYNVTPAQFKKHVAAIKASGLPVQTVSAAIASLQAQL